MPQIPQLKRLLDDGMRLTEVPRSRAGQLASDLRAHGMHATSQVSATVEGLLEGGRWRSNELRQSVRSKAQRPFGALGLATKRDVATLAAVVTEEVSGAVEELGAFPSDSDELRATVRVEVQRQLSALGVATKEDLGALERRLKPAATKTTSRRRAPKPGDKASDEQASGAETDREQPWGSEAQSRRAGSTLATRPL
jgi:hypothetical protein